MSTRNISFIAAGQLLFVLLAGCTRDQYINQRMALASPQPPPILSTPALYLLTNSPGFIADVKIEEQRGATAGRLFGSGPKLYFAPAEKQRNTKYGPVGGFSFIWDANKNSGYVLSEALQGYAPISHSGLGSITNVAVAPTKTGAASSVVTVALANGKEIRFEGSNLSPAAVPQRITGGTPPFNARLEKVRSETPPADAFKVPEGFTAYPSAEAIVDEISLRYRNLKRRVY